LPADYDRRAEVVKRLLVEQFKFPADALVAVGFGKQRLKNAADPLAGENRRVEIVETRK
jgi:flagellar motor protein MotB